MLVESALASRKLRKCDMAVMLLVQARQQWAELAAGEHQPRKLGTLRVRSTVGVLALLAARQLDTAAQLAVNVSNGQIKDRSSPKPFTMPESGHSPLASDANLTLPLEVSSQLDRTRPRPISAPGSTTVAGGQRSWKSDG